MANGGIRTPATAHGYPAAIVRGMVSRTGARSGEIVVSDGTTEVDAFQLTINGATVTDNGNGIAQINIRDVSVANSSGVDLIAGDVVIVDTATDDAFTTTTTAQVTKPVGIVQEAIAAGTSGLVRLAGPVDLVNVTASVTRGAYAETSTSAKKATSNSTRRAGSFAIFTTGGTTPAAILFGVPDLNGTITVPAFATPSIALGTAAAAGAASTVIRSDATIAAFDATVPVSQAIADSAAAGSAAVAARRDHKHGMPSAATPSGGYGTAAAGSAATLLRSDAVLAKPTAADVDFSADVTTNNVTSGHHGLAPKGDGSAAHYLDGTGSYSTPGVSAAGLNAGTSNPGSPATNDLYHRTDLGLIIKYDGTRWLTADKYQAELHPLDTLTGLTTNHNIYATLPSNLFACYLDAAYVTYIVTTTNDGTKFWTMQLQTKSSPNTDTNRGSSFNTSARTATTYYQNTIALGIALAATELAVELNVTKTSTPGAVYVQCVVLYRLIVT